MSDLSFSPIKRVSRLTYDEFVRFYDQPQLPVVITDATSEWPAMKKWSHQWFKEQHGCVEAELSVEKTHTTRATSMTMAQYIDLVLTGRDRGLYLDQLSFDRIPSLVGDVATPYVNPNRRNVMLNLWLGPAGTFISLHKDNHSPFDHMNNIFAQILGRKQVVLVSPQQDCLMYPKPKEQGAYWHSQVDWEHPDFDRFPLFRDVKCEEAIVQPGELLFIPGNYWHSVRALDQSISVSCWWYVHRIVDVAVTSAKRAHDPSLPNDQITLADVEEFGGIPRVAAALESDDLSTEERHVIFSAMDRGVSAMISKHIENSPRSSLDIHHVLGT
jgi:hypothetical protein